MDIYYFNITPLRNKFIFERNLSKVSKKRQEKIARLKRNDDKLRCLGAGLLIEFIKEKYNINDEIVIDKFGKPHFLRTKDSFNISHSGDYVVCAVSDREIGIDIEKRAKARMEVAGRFFHGEEVAQLKMLEEDKQDQLFFNYWSVKESFLKYIGTGLARPLNSFIVSFSGGGVSLFERGNKLPLYVHACPVDDGYACHVCCEYEELTGIHEIFLEEITGC